MGKVLACPACGNKHPLDLLVGLDSFQCKQCGKKLAVPNEAMSIIKESVPSAKPIVKTETSRVPTKKQESKTGQTKQLQQGAPKEEVVVLARATMSPQEELTSLAKDQKRTNAEEKQTYEAIGQDRKQKQESNKQNSALGDDSFLAPLVKLSKIPIPLFGKVVAWLFAIPFGFFMVVLLPRFFKKGFHASDFVGIITNPGISRYGILVTLVFLWSFVTVIGVFIFNLLLRKFFLSKKIAK